MRGNENKISPVENHSLPAYFEMGEKRDIKIAEEIHKMAAEDKVIPMEQLLLTREDF